VATVKVRVAAANMKLRILRKLRSDGDYLGHLHDLVTTAHDEGAEVLVLPELHVLELLQLEPDLHEHKVVRYLAQYAQPIEEWMARISQLSGLIIVGGSHFKETPEGFKNVCAIGIPNHGVVLAEKNNLTGYEKNMWELARGRGLARLPKGLGVNICYDSEFPPAARALAEDGMQILCVPAWTETQRGFQRVRWSCQARALENTCFAVHASLVGDLGREPVPMSHGSSAIIAPSVEPFPVQAILRESPENEEAVIVADLDFAMLSDARRNYEVSNWADRDAGDWTVTRHAVEEPDEAAGNEDGLLN